MGRPGSPNPEASEQPQRERSSMASQAKRRALGSRQPRAPGARAQEEREEMSEDTDGSGEESGGSDEEDEEEEDELVNQEVSVEFEAHSISSNDFDGIKKLLQQLFLKAAVNVGELTNLLIQQSHVGSVIKIALPMHQQLQKELMEAQQANQPCGKCYYYLLISKTFQEVSNSKKKGNAPQKEELMFANAEEEFFYEKALLKFSYCVQEESGLALGGSWSFDDSPMRPLRTVMVIPASRMGSVMEALREYLSV